MPKPADNWWGEVRAVLLKDIRSELRTKSALGTILMFSLVTMVLISFTVVTEGLGFTQGLRDDWRDALARGESILLPYHTPQRAMLLASLYWVVLFFSGMAGLPRVFVKEEELRTAAALRLAARPSAVFAGKLLFNVALLEGIAFLLLPPFLLFFKPQVLDWPLLLATLAAGSAAMAGAATILGAMVARAGNRGYLMLVLGFGPLLPILILAINGTTAAIHGTGGNNIIGLVSYLVAMTVLSGVLFEQVWSE